MRKKKQYNFRCPALAGGSLLNHRYKIIRELGRGGFSITYLAYDTDLEINVAAKECCPPEASRGQDGLTLSVPADISGQFADRKGFFQKEAEFTFGTYDRTGICAARDFFEANQTVYIIEEYLPGGTLKQALQSHSGKRMAPGDVFLLFLPVMQGLAFLHAKGSIHGDLSPDNLMFDGKGRMKMVDFGSSYLFSGEKKSHRTFKPRYAAPEQYRKEGNIGPWTDIYGLSAVLYEVLTGIPPYSVPARLKGKEMKAIRNYADVKPEAEHAIFQGMQLDIPKRYFYIGTFMEHLGLTLPDTEAFFSETRRTWNEAWMRASTDEHSLFPVKRRLLGRRQAKLLKRTMIVTAICCTAAFGGAFLYLQANPEKVLRLRLQRERVLAQKEKPAVSAADPELLDSLKQYRNSDIESDTASYYNNIPEKWFRTHSVFTNPDELFPAGVSLMEDVLACYYGQDPQAVSQEFSGSATYRSADQSIVFNSRKTGEYRIADPDGGTIRIQMIYDIGKDRLSRIRMTASREELTVFLKEIFPYAAAGKYLTDAEIETLLSSLDSEEGADTRADGSEKENEIHVYRNYYMRLSDYEGLSGGDNLYTVSLARTEDALYFG